MMRHTFRIAIFISILLIPSQPTFGQDGPEEALRWFPPGVYEGFLHLDRTFRPDDELSSTLERLISSEFEDSLLESVPFIKNFDSSTLALADSVDLESPEKGRVSRRKKETTGFLFFWREMLVVRGADLAAQIGTAEKEGVIERISGKGSSPILYRYSSRSGKEPVYLHRTVSGEVLVCQNRLVLLAMIASGMGARLGVLDDPDMAEMLTYMPSAPIWFMVPTVHKQRAVLADMVERGADEAEVDDQREQMEKGQQFYVALVDAEDNVVFHELHVFADSECAEAALDDEDALNGVGSPFPEETMIDENKEVSGRSVYVLQRYSLKKLREIRDNQRRLENRRKETSGRDQ